MSEPIKPESIIAYLGFKAEDIKTEDDFKKNFETKFGIKDQLLKDPEFTSKIFGHRVGSIESAAKSGFKKMGADFSKEEIEGKKVEEIIEIGLNKVAEINKKAMEDLERQSRGTVDEQVKELKEKYKSVESKLKDTEGLLNKTTSEYEGFKKDIVVKGKSEKINSFKKDKISKLAYMQGASHIQKIGFETVINDKYDFDLDENESPFIKDKKTGQRVPSKKVIGQFMTADEILQDELVANNLAQINKDGGKPINKYSSMTQGSPEPSATNTLFIHPNARKAAGM